MRRFVAAVSVLGAAVVAAAAVGDGSVVANPPVAVISTATGSVQLTNTTTKSYTVTLAPDPSCDPAVGLVGANPFALGMMASHTVQLTCAAGQPAGLQRCLFHATDANKAALVDLLAVCEYAAQPTLQPSVQLVDFGSVTIGDASVMTIALGNGGPTAIHKLFVQTTDLGETFAFSMPCNPDAAYCNSAIPLVPTGGQAQVAIKCAPQSVGMHQAQLVVATDTSQALAQTVTLQCTGTAAVDPVLAVNPTAVDVASPVEVTTGSASTVVHLSNAGGGMLTINDIRTVDVVPGAAIDWSHVASNKCSGAIPPACTLAHGEQIDLAVTFDPAAIGRRDASLLVSYHDTIDRTSSIPLDGVGQGATLELVGEQTMLDLGSVPAGHTAMVDFELANHGNRDTTAMLSLMPVAPFALAPATSATVTPTAPKPVTASCTPTAPGTFSTMITASSSDAFMSPPIVVAATCEGTASPLYASPTAVALGEIRIGGGTVTKPIQLLSANSPLTLSGAPQLDVANPNAMVGSASSTTTPATFDLVIDPQTEGDLANHIIVTDTANDTLRIPLTGRIVTASYVVPPALDIGTFCINQPTTSSNLALTSTGTATITVQAPTLGMAASPFALSLIAPTVYPSALLPGGPATVAVTPQRQASTATLADTVTWTTDVAGKLTQTTAISAKFIDKGGAIAPPALDFGRVVVHIFRDDGQRVMIQNCNPSVLLLDPPTIKAPFSIDSPSFPTMLNPNETATFSVGFHPTKIGVVSDALTISSPQPGILPLQVALVGEGVSGGAPGDDAGVPPVVHAPTSFYACSCTSSGPGGWPIALAVVLVIVRRRRGSS